MKLAELRTKLKSLGLDDSGTRDVLEQRLLSHEKKQSDASISLTFSTTSSSTFSLFDQSCLQNRVSAFDRIRHRQPPTITPQITDEFEQLSDDEEDPSVEKLTERAEKWWSQNEFENLEKLKERKRRFEEESAPVLCNITMAKEKRFRSIKFAMNNN